MSKEIIIRFGLFFITRDFFGCSSSVTLSKLNVSKPVSGLFSGARNGVDGRIFELSLGFSMFLVAVNRCTISVPGPVEPRFCEARFGKIFDAKTFVGRLDVSSAGRGLFVSSDS